MIYKISCQICGDHFDASKIAGHNDSVSVSGDGMTESLSVRITSDRIVRRKFLISFKTTRLPFSIAAQRNVLSGTKCITPCSVMVKSCLLKQLADSPA